MGHGVHIQVTIPSSEPDALFELAKASLREKWAETLFDVASIPGATEGYEFLDDLRNKKAFSKWGNEGDLVLWGMVGDHSDPRAFAEILRPFWTALFSSDPEVVSQSWRKILIVHTDAGGTGISGLFEIGWDDDESDDREIVIRTPQSEPFSCI